MRFRKARSPQENIDMYKEVLTVRVMEEGLGVEL